MNETEKDKMKRWYNINTNDEGREHSKDAYSTYVRTYVRVSEAIEEARPRCTEGCTRVCRRELAPEVNKNVIQQWCTHLPYMISLMKKAHYWMSMAVS